MAFSGFCVSVLQDAALTMHVLDFNVAEINRLAIIHLGFPLPVASQCSLTPRASAKATARSDEVSPPRSSLLSHCRVIRTPQSTDTAAAKSSWVQPRRYRQVLTR